MRPKAHLALGRVLLGRVLLRGLKRATIGPMGLRPHFFNRGPRPGPIAAVKTRPKICLWPRLKRGLSP